MKNTKPIGIFDSGIGGLTVAKAISKHMPNEQFIYFGDTAHLPYGDKSKEAIRRYSTNITEFLLANECKAIVIACNTASAIAYDYLKEKYLGSVPIINVIDPIVEAVIKNGQHKEIGLIATTATVASGVYQEKIRRREASLKMNVLATPLLAPMIEEGFSKDKISKIVIENYLSNPIFANIDALILGCTHYVLIKDEINDFFNGRIKLYDSTDIVAHKMERIFKSENLLNTERQAPNYFFVSDMTDTFQVSTSRFYGENIQLELMKL